MCTSGADAAAEVAAFDLDGTLTRRDTMVPFLQRLCGTSALVRAVVPEWGSIADAARGSVDRDATKARVLARLLAGWSVEEVTSAAAAFADAVVTHRLRPDTLERARWHREQGHHLVIVSASPEIYVGPIAERLDFDATIATRLEVSEGRLTGALLGANVRGAEKVRRLHEYLRGPPRRLWAYGNSAGDRELLAAADDATRVTRRGLVAVRR